MVNSTSHRRLIRELELAVLLNWFPRGGRILEIGAGAGWQAKSLAGHGFEVEAVDLAGGRYDQVRIWPVTLYDGQHLPFPDQHFDAVFSSNVLEHIPHLEQFQDEIRRVLTLSGVALHVLPTPSWRAWTACAFYVNLAKRLLARLNRKTGGGGRPVDREPGGAPAPAGSTGGGIRLWPGRHGERGCLLDELYLFSARRWRRFFRSTGWQVMWDQPLGLFYTGHRIRGERLGVRARLRLARLLGSSSRAFLLRKPESWLSRI